MNFAKAYRRELVTNLDRLIDRTLNKAAGVNKPFKAIQRTDDYKGFQTMFEGGLSEQAAWIVKNIESLLDSAGVEDNLQPLDLVQAQTLKGLVSRDMPLLKDFVSEHKVTQSLTSFFEFAAIQQYKRWGYVNKSKVSFTLTNQKYITELSDRSNYLLNKSGLDSTTLDNVISTVSEGRLDGMTNPEVAMFLKDRFDDINQVRADMITRTESANAMGNANYATAKENGAQTHSWVAAGDAEDELCQGNVDDGDVPIDQPFSSGDMSEPAHPNCECYTEAGEIDLDSVDVWVGN